MTTVVWDGTILAADSRVSSSHPHQNKKHYKCSSCGEEAKRLIREDALKVRTFTKATQLFRGERILVAGMSGNNTSGEALFTLLERGVDIEKLHANALTMHAVPQIDAMLLIVTRKNIYQLDITGKELKVEKHDLQKPFAIGSGRMAAMLAIKLLGANAVDAVKAASLVDSATGGSVNWLVVNFDTQDVIPGNNEAEQNVDKLRESLLDLATKEKATLKKKTRVTNK